MKYTLAVLAHGGERSPLERCLDSFMEHVTPEPSFVRIVHDGPGYVYMPRFGEAPVVATTDLVQRGFCESTRALWTAVAQGDAPYVFWLEHDFVFLRDVDLRDLAAVLDTDVQLAQMQLMRQAVNEEERAAGGLYELRREQYRPRTEVIRDGRVVPMQEWRSTDVGHAWLRHTAYMTTNPCLMRRSFMNTHWWPDYDSECEGRFGLDLVAESNYFGVWGAGEPWVEHVGVRDGFGY